LSVIVAGVGLTLTILLGIFTVGLGHASALRMRSQIAADAAALAAVAESAPHGGGRPQAVAERYARSNGARLLECRCVPGATAVQVTVAVGKVAADARAVFDPDVLLPAPRGTAEGLHPSLAAAVRELVSASRGRVHVVSGWRSPEEQARLWAEALDRYGSAEAADEWVAPPGHSMHERGLAVDLGGDLDLAVRLIDRLGLPLYRPMDHEPWHFELIGSRSDEP
jgi:hypothetical protein